jgi:glucose-1-phosphate cytidylyltransferase
MQIITRDVPTQVVILCGGRGERMGGLTLERPKPMIEIGGRPILWHIMQHFARHGFTDFTLALGYLGWVVDWYFKDPESADGWTVHCVPTGWETQSGGRVKRLAPHLTGTFLMSWCDGLSDIDLTAMLAFHRDHGKLCTVAAVHPPARFGELILDGDSVQAFVAAPRNVGWINAGFFVCEPGVLDYIEGDRTPWEDAPMVGLAKVGELVAFRHAAFWQCMDTEKEQRLLDELWRSGRAPWKARG